MPRGIPNKPRKNGVATAEAPADAVALMRPLEATLDDVRVLMESRRAEYQSSADRLAEIISTLVTPTPRIGRPPARAK